ncbi:hypothetical protein [Polymorphospora sp. NPDC050346]|uniref:hypothetical protein n=1 Tax=Polymorphospora sp. NPDC050346 TaxID=3155780 RepID=UPI0033FEE956
MPRWVGPGAVTTGGDISGTVNTGPTYVQVVAGRFDRVHDAVFDPAPLAEQLDLARFQGRADLIARIDERIAVQDRGYVVVRGEAGVGKSALAAHLVWTRPCVHHFTRLGGGARNPVEARRSLAAQLIGGWGLADRFTPGDVFPAAAERPEWLAKVIRAAAAARDAQNPNGPRLPLVLVVDGLDEAEPDPPDMGTGIPLGLPTPDDLPAGVYVVATSQYGLPLAALQDRLRVGWSQIDVEGSDNLADMAAYLRAAITGPHPDAALTRALADHHVPAGAFTATLMDRCRGVWIYLRYVLDEIRAGLRAPDDVACLPDRLRGYYELQIQQRWATHPDWESLHLPTLAILAALGRPATSADLATILDRPTSVDRIADWLDGPARAFLDATPTGPGRIRHYQVRHQSLRDLFTTPPSTDDGGEPIGGAGLAHRLRTAWTTAHQQITAWLTPPASGGGDWTSIDDYTRLQLPAHAAAGGVLDPLMIDPGFLMTCLPWQVLRYRHILTAPGARRAAATLEGAATTDWNIWTNTERAWWLHIWARKTRTNDLANTLITAYPDWPWHVHTAIWNGNTHRTLIGHTPVTALAVLPRPVGHHYIITGSRDDLTVQIWDPDTGIQLAELAGHVNAVAVLPRPDGRHHIITDHWDKTVRVWDPYTGLQRAELAGHTGLVTAVAVLPRPDRRHHIVTGSNDGTVRVWDPDTGLQRAELAGHVNAVAVLPRPDGRHHIITGGWDGTVRVWDPNTGTQLAELTGHANRVNAVAVLPRPDGRHYIITGGSDGTVRIWDPDTGLQLAKLAGHTGLVTAVAVLPRPDRRHHIVTGSNDGTVRVWDPDTGTQRAELTGHLSGVTGVAVLPRPDRHHHIITGSADETVRIWDPDADTQLSELAGHTDPVSAVAVLPRPDGRHHIITGGWDGTVRVWDPDTGLQLAKLAGHTGLVTAVAVLPRPDRRHHIVTGSNDGTVRVWDPDTGTQRAELAGHTGLVTAVAVLPRPDRRHHIVTGSIDGTVRVWDPDTGTQRAELTGHLSGVTGVAVLPRPDRHHHIITGSADGTVRIWDPDADTQLSELAGHTARVTAVAVLPRPDRRHHIVTGSNDGTVRVWDPDTGTQRAELAGHTDPVTAVAVLPRPDRRHHIITGSNDGTARIWDPDAGTQLAELTGHLSGVTGVAVLPRPDGRHHIITGSADQTTLVWMPALESAAP